MIYVPFNDLLTITSIFSGWRNSLYGVIHSFTRNQTHVCESLQLRSRWWQILWPSLKAFIESFWNAKQTCERGIIFGRRWAGNIILNYFYNPDRYRFWSIYTGQNSFTTKFLAAVQNDWTSQQVYSFCYLSIGKKTLCVWSQFYPSWNQFCQLS